MRYSTDTDDDLNDFNHALPTAGDDDDAVGAGARVSGWVGMCWRWTEELRESLRGRRLFTLFALVNLVNYLDRGVVPGGSEEFNMFITKDLRTARPDVFLGVLQSAFILGFSVSCLIFARMARFHSPFNLMSAGLGVWCASAFMAGLAYPLESYFFLLFARLLSGVGEASFVTVVPPLITETAPPGERGVWLALFYTAMPVGAGVGYVYGSVLASSSLGWPWAFYLEALIMAPLAIACGLVPRDQATFAPNSADYGCDSASSSLGSKPPFAKHNSSSPAELNSISYRSYDAAAHDARHGGRRDAHDSDDESCLTEAPSRSGEAAEGRQGARPRPHVSRSGSGSQSTLRSGGVSGDRGFASEEVGDREGKGTGHTSATTDYGTSAEPCRRNSDDGNTSSAGSDGLGVGGPECEEEGDTEQGRGVATLKEPSSLGSLNSGDVGVASDSTRVLRVDHNTSDPTHQYRRPDSNERDALISTATATGGAIQHPDLLGDLLGVLNRPIFVLVVFGAAANAAVTAGMSTFGTGFILALELLHTETAAAATFGAIICAAGLIGTPAGGGLIDSADVEGRLGDEKKLAVVMHQALCLVSGATVVLVAATAQSSLLPFLTLFFIGATLLFAYTPHMNLAVMLAAPAHLRPLAIAINSVMLHALGDVPSPTVVGAIKDALAPHCTGSSSPLNSHHVIDDLMYEKLWPTIEYAATAAVSSGSMDSLDGFPTDGFANARLLDGESWADLDTVHDGRGGQVLGDGFRTAWEGLAAAAVTAAGEGAYGRSGDGEGSPETAFGISDACREERRGLHLTLFLIASWLLWAILFFFLAKLLQNGGLEHGKVPVRWGDVSGLIAKFWSGIKCGGRGCTRFCRPKRRGNSLNNVSAFATHGDGSCFRRAARKLGLSSGKPRSAGLPSLRIERGEGGEMMSSLEQPLLYPAGSKALSPTSCSSEQEV